MAVLINFQIICTSRLCFYQKKTFPRSRKSGNCCLWPLQAAYCSSLCAHAQLSPRNVKQNKSLHHEPSHCVGIGKEQGAAVQYADAVSFCLGYSYYESNTLKSKSEQEHDCATLPRAVSSAAAVRKRTKFPMIARTEVETHRFSINGHFYNYEVWM